MKTIYFYFDFISPYTYLAWSQIPQISKTTPYKIIFKPTLFAGLLNYHSNIGPAEIPAKREYVFKDAFRLCHQENLPIVGPPSHPFPPLLPLRLCLATSSEEEKQRLSGALIQACWGLGKDISDKKILEKILIENDFDSEALMYKVQTQEIKDSLKDNVMEAVNKGVFGVPTFTIDQELFWGHDRIPLLISYLKNDYFIDRDAINQALARPREADRKEFS